VVEELIILIIGLVILFSGTIIIVLKATKNIKGKTIVKIGFETVAMKTYMELAMQNDNPVCFKKENEQDSFPKLPTL
jgi:hypothetical protein